MSPKPNPSHLARPEQLSDLITREVLTWPGVTAHAHRFGGTEYRLGTREIGHLHGDHLLDVPLPRTVRDRLIAEGRASAHHVLPESGWVSLTLRGGGDRAAALELLRRSYDLAVQQRGRRAANPRPLSKWCS